MKLQSGRHEAAEAVGLVADEKQARVALLQPAEAEVDRPRIGAVVVLYCRRFAT